MPGPHEMRTIRVKHRAKAELGFAPHADIDDALARAREMTQEAQRRMEAIWSQPRHSDRRDAWVNDAPFATWFGTDALTKKQMRRMLRRIRRLRNRLHKHIAFVVHPTTGRGSGGCSRPTNPTAYKRTGRKIHLCPRWWTVLNNTNERASVIVHELRHRGGLPGSMWHFGSANAAAAQNLAANNPRRARRNPENWEHFMRAM